MCILGPLLGNTILENNAHRLVYFELGSLDVVGEIGIEERFVVERPSFDGNPRPIDHWARPELAHERVEQRQAISVVRETRKPRTGCRP